MDQFFIILVAAILGVATRTLKGWLEKASAEGKLPTFNPIFLASAIAAAISSVMVAIGLAFVFTIPESMTNQAIVGIWVFWQSYGFNDAANPQFEKIAAPRIATSSST